jgi:hypothetical protein
MSRTSQSVLWVGVSQAPGASAKANRFSAWVSTMRSRLSFAA